jgi:hypothetical protein
MRRDPVASAVVVAVGHPVAFAVVLPAVAVSTVRPAADHQAVTAVAVAGATIATRIAIAAARRRRRSVATKTTTATREPIH